MSYGCFTPAEALITSRQNRRVVSLGKLTDRKAREEAGLFRFDGVKLLCEALRRGVKLHSLFLRAGSEAAVAGRMHTLYGLSPDDVKCPVYTVADELFDRISEENSPEGVICVAHYIDKCHKMCTIDKEAFPVTVAGPVILLESVRDPGNVGAIIRSAAALGMAQMIISRDCADLYHPRTVRAAMGPLFSMPITRVGRLTDAIAILRARGYAVNATALDDHAQRLGEANLCLTAAGGRGSPCAVIGNEGHGLSSEVIRACDRTVYIPMEANAESLNAGVAAALIMWEMRRSCAPQA